MKTRKLTLLLLLTAVTVYSSNLIAQSSSEGFLGMWALDLDYESNKVGWLEVRQENGYLDADLLWRWGSVEPVESVLAMDDHMILTRSNTVVREKDANGKPLRIQRPVTWIDITPDGEDRIAGAMVIPNRNGEGVEIVSFSGKKIPETEGTPDPSSIKYGKSVKLLGKKDLTGWELLEKGSVNGWSVDKGVLVNNPVQKEGEPHIGYGNLRTTDTFNDFNLKLEVNVPAGSNSGVYIKGIYEIQVFDSYGKPLDSHNMGALYSRIAPSESAEKPAGEWQELDITLHKRHITVVLNGVKIIDNQPVKGVTGGAITADEFIPGPIYLQGDHGEVSYRNIILTPIIE